MSTRSYIAFDNGDEVYMIYCHFDGYVDGVGITLNEHYTDIEKVEALMDLGDISVLGSEIGEKQDFDKPHTGWPSWCLAYGRDRGETDVEARTFVNLQHAENSFNAGGIDYMYVFDGREWLFRRYGHKTFSSLREHLTEKA
jgi:hypothetical protein